MVKTAENPPVILASSSPYRKDLLARLGIPFQCESPGIDESARSGETGEQLARRLSESKARTVASHYPGAIIIGSDQVATLQGEILAKTGTHAKAMAQLQKLSGRRVHFHTGLCVINDATQSIQVDCIPYYVRFRNLASEEIDRYLSSEQPYQCTACFKSEGLGICLVADMQGGDSTALIGLPLARLSEMLRLEGFSLP
jgi:septum formation protein